MSTTTVTTADIEGRHRGMTAAEAKVIFASSLGTVFEWYDFYLIAILTPIIGAQFFGVIDPATKLPMFNESTRDIFALLVFAAGFIVRPFGALFFGRIGDLIGRKTTFLVTILIMGLSTFIVGFIPSAQDIGIWAPATLIFLRLLQGLALGGEYGGAATYVAEHAPEGRRGFYTSWIQTTATLGLFLALLVILTTRTMVGEPAFAAWYWRVPFLVSIILLLVSLWIRLQLNESPVFQKMKDEGKGSSRPWAESFGDPKNAWIVLVALFGLTAGQGVVWYTGQFYALFFLQSIMKVDGPTANYLIAWSLLLGTGFFIFFGWLSDKIGRKPIILAGCLLAALTYFTLFDLLARTANPRLHNAVENAKVEVIADQASCGSLFNPFGIAKFSTPCDTARVFLASTSARYNTVYGPSGSGTKVRIGDKDYPFTAAAASGPAITAALQEAGYPKPGEAGIVKMTNIFDFNAQSMAIIGILFILVLYVTMVYGPIAAALVELFPTRIRYTSMSLPYHIGNGWFGGLLPATAAAMVASTGNIYYGLWYPIGFAIMTFVVGLFLVPETYKRYIFKD